jgi:hypothetical protein
LIVFAKAQVTGDEKRKLRLLAQGVRLENFMHEEIREPTCGCFVSVSEVTDRPLLTVRLMRIRTVSAGRNIGPV